MSGWLAGLLALSSSVGTVVQEDIRLPQPWRALSAQEQAQFDLGHAVFNTQFSPAGASASRTDGLGPVFNVPSCDACHNSRRRGRGPRDSGEAPADLVIQLGRLLPDGSIERGTAEYGHVLNTSAVRGVAVEGTVLLRYTESTRKLADGSSVTLRTPAYEVKDLSGPDLPITTVLMPRMPPPLFGVGLLERVPKTAASGRFGWQATAATVAEQTAIAFGREMGLTTTLVTHDDCGSSSTACRDAPNGGVPEVDPALFDALVTFQSLPALPVKNSTTEKDAAAATFKRLGCATCHRPTLPVDLRGSVIHPFTDLQLHDLGEELADRDLAGRPVRSAWRTAPLWGMGASVTSGQPLRLLHDGRARTIEEAILWHGGRANEARLRFEHLDVAQRRLLIVWIERL